MLRCTHSRDDSDTMPESSGIYAVSLTESSTGSETEITPLVNGMRHQVIPNQGDEVSPNTRADETNKLIVESTMWMEYYDGTAERNRDP